LTGFLFLEPEIAVHDLAAAARDACRARLAEALLEGHDPSDCANRFGVSRATVRSQLAALFDKTGRRRQATLLVLLAAVAATPPLTAALMHGAAA
jgi:DNA-binding NarL/FixJ family response regulator